MEIRSLKMVYFSPTGTTKAVIQGIARGIDQGLPALIDITTPAGRNQPLKVSENDLLVVGVPVYVGRVPALALEWLSALSARQTPAVCVVVYGNREFDDALLELKAILVASGCRPIAGAAFIGEHSFSSADTPIAVNRPDAGDLRQAEAFGKQISQTLRALSSTGGISDLTVPGNTPYREREAELPADFIAVGDNCVQCGSCAEICPGAAIDSIDSAVRDERRCILCCACIKGCPQNARTMKAGRIKAIANRLHNMCQERKEPAFFF